MELFAAEEVVNRAGLQDACFERPFGKDIAQNEVGRAVPQLLEFLHELAEKDGRRVDDDEVAGIGAEEVFAAAPHAGGETALAPGAQCSAGALEASGVDAKNASSLFLSD